MKRTLISVLTLCLAQLGCTANVPWEYCFGISNTPVGYTYQNVTVSIQIRDSSNPSNVANITHQAWTDFQSCMGSASAESFQQNAGGAIYQSINQVANQIANMDNPTLVSAKACIDGGPCVNGTVGISKNAGVDPCADENSSEPYYVHDKCADPTNAPSAQAGLNLWSSFDFSHPASARKVELKPLYYRAMLQPFLKRFRKFLSPSKVSDTRDLKEGDGATANRDERGDSTPDITRAI